MGENFDQQMLYMCVHGYTKNSTTHITHYIIFHQSRQLQTVPVVLYLTFLGFEMRSETRAKAHSMILDTLFNFYKQLYFKQLRPNFGQKTKQSF